MSRVPIFFATPVLSYSFPFTLLWSSHISYYFKYSLSVEDVVHWKSFGTEWEEHSFYLCTTFSRLWKIKTTPALSIVTDRLSTQVWGCNNCAGWRMCTGYWVVPFIGVGHPCCSECPVKSFTCSMGIAGSSWLLCWSSDLTSTSRHHLDGTRTVISVKAEGVLHLLWLLHLYCLREELLSRNSC